MSHNLTIIIYLSIIISSTALAFASQRIRYVDGIYTTVKFNKSIFLISFIIAWIFIAFTNIGVDYYNYYYIVRQESWQTFTSIFSVEPGFGLICVLLKQFVSTDAHVVLFILKTVSIILAFWGIYLTRNKVVVGYAVAAYMGLAYLPSFYLMSISIAMGVVFLAMGYYINKHKFFLPIILLIIAAQIHNAVYLFIPVVIALIVVEKAKNASNLIKALLILAYIAFGVFAGRIYNIAQTSISSFHYGNYGSNAFSGSGAMIIVLYVPLLLILYLFYKKYEISEIQRNRLFVFALSSLFFNVLSYQFTVVERMEFLLLSLYTCFIPEVLFSSGVIKHERGLKYKTLTGMLYIAYLVFRIYLTIDERTTVASGLSQYFFFNPFAG